MADHYTGALELDLLRLFQAVGRDLWEAGLVTSHGGNMSIRETSDRVLITRTGSMLGHLEASDVVWLVDGQPQSDIRPSSDTALHLAVYATVPDASAVVHAHARHAIALSLLVEEEIVPLDREGQYHLAKVPVVPFTDDLPAALAAALREHKIAVVAGHGSYARGHDLWEALQWTTVLEESAHVLVLHRSLNRR